MVSKFHNVIQDSKGHEDKIYTIVKSRETFYHRHTVSVTSCSEVKYVLKKVILYNWFENKWPFWILSARIYTIYPFALNQSYVLYSQQYTFL